MEYVLHLILMGALIGVIFGMKLFKGTFKRELIKSIVFAVDAVLLEIVIWYLVNGISGMVSDNDVAYIVVLCIGTLADLAVFTFANMMICSCMGITRLNYFTLGVLVACALGMIAINILQLQITKSYLASLQGQVEAFDEIVLLRKLNAWGKLSRALLILPATAYNIYAVVFRREQLHSTTE